MKNIIRTVDCCIVLHNFLVLGGDDEVPLGWADETDAQSDIEIPLGELDVLNQPIPVWAEADSRRGQLYEYIRENVLF